MTRTKKILNLIAKQGPMTVEEIAANLGVSVNEVRHSIGDMGKRGHIQSRPSTYSITDQGDRWRQVVPKTGKEEIARRVAKRREMREADRYYRAKTSTAEQIVARAKSIPNSVFALGGSA